MAADDQGMKDDKKTHKWTLVVLGDHGQFGTYEIRKSTVAAAAVAIVIVMLVTMGYLWLQRTSDRRLENDLREKLAASEQLIAAATGKNAELSRKIAEMEDALAAAFKEEKHTEDGAPVTSPDQFNKMAVEHFEIAMDEPSGPLRFKFLLRNTKSYNNPVSGHVFVILRPEYLNVSTWSSYPNTELAEGRPHDTAGGESFTIARFKTIRGSFKTIPQRMEQFFISVWVFSDDGILIMTKDFFIRKG
jgi:hypothetical protein